MVAGLQKSSSQRCPCCMCELMLYICVDITLQWKRLKLDTIVAILVFIKARAQKGLVLTTHLINVVVLLSMSHGAIMAHESI